MKITTSNGIRMTVAPEALLHSEAALSHSFATTIARRLASRLMLRVRVVPNQSGTGWVVREVGA